jgi:hypothetical protein
MNTAASHGFDFNYVDDDTDEKRTLFHCCGVVEVGDFRCNGNMEWDSMSPDTIQAIKERFTKINRMLVGTTNNTQTDVATVLEATGWKCAAEYVNPNSGNNVYLWSFVP